MSLLLQEVGGYFELESGAGRILLEAAVFEQPASTLGGFYDERELLARLAHDDDEIAALVAALLAAR